MELRNQGVLLSPSIQVQNCLIIHCCSCNPIPKSTGKEQGRFFVTSLPEWAHVGESIIIVCFNSSREILHKFLVLS